VSVALRRTYDAPAAACAPALVDGLEAAVARAGVRPFRLPSGAGHDGLAVQALCPIGMLFVAAAAASATTRPRASRRRTPAWPSTSWATSSATSTPRPSRARQARSMSTDGDHIQGRVAGFLDGQHEAQAAFLAELVKVPSDNPPGDCSMHAERAAELLEGLGLEVERHPVPEGQVRANGMVSATNLVVRRRFGQGGPTIALNAHGDVVPPGEGWTRDPFGARSWTAGCTAAAPRSRSPTSRPTPSRSWRWTTSRRPASA
jgi:hypothetical protein